MHDSRNDKSTVPDGLNLSFSSLDLARQKVMHELIEVSSQANAAQVLKVGKTVQAEIDDNVHLKNAATDYVWQIYAGVLYDAVGYKRLDSCGQKFLNDRMVIVSALWGLVRLEDKIPRYRLSMCVTLPSLGRLSTWWKKTLACDEKISQELCINDKDQLIINCRSTDYTQALLTGPQKTCDINIFTEEPGKARKVVTHFAKYTRGQVIGFLAKDPLRASELRFPGELVEILKEKWRVEYIPAQGRIAHQINIILPGTPVG